MLKKILIILVCIFYSVISTAEDIAYTNKISLVPESINGFYSVTKSGRVVQYSGNNSKLQMTLSLPNNLDKDMNITRGDFLGYAKYYPNSGVINAAEQIKIPPNLKQQYSNCRSGVFSAPYKTKISRIKLDNDQYSNNKWLLQPYESRGVCVYPVTSSASCKVVKCTKYEYHENIITNNLNLALDMAYKNQKNDSSKGYFEKLREIEKIEADKKRAESKENARLLKQMFEKLRQSNY